jgi:DNA polymerase-3 subunit chi
VARVNFYSLRHDDTEARLQFACRLCEQLWRQGHALCMLTQDEDEARAFDQLLWTFSPESFVPHALYSDAPENCPVLIDWNPTRFNGGSLLNLSDALPPQHESFDSIAEFIFNNEEAKALSRRKWASYKQWGHELLHRQV